MNERKTRILDDLNHVKVPLSVLGIYYLFARLFMRSLCPSVILTGFPCPGCGMTRAMFAILNGNFEKAWKLHPFSYALIAFAIWFCIWRYVFLKDMTMIYKMLTILFLAMIVFYIYRMFRYFPGESPMSYYYDSFLNKILNLFGKVVII